MKPFIQPCLVQPIAFTRHSLFARLIVFAWMFTPLNFLSAQQPGTPWQANPEQVAKDSKRNPQFIYDEANVPSFVLPDPLKMTDGSPVTSAQQWNKGRRDELLELFRSEVYGHRPETEFAVRFEILSERDDLFAGLATGRDMQAIITIDGRSFKFPFTAFIPNSAKRKAPVIVLINNRHASSVQTVADQGDPIWPVQKLIEQGYATAAFHTSDVDPDSKDGYANGIRSFFANGQPPQNDAWRSLSAWGWGGSRVLDYMVSQPEVDSSRAAIAGHSRAGKTALWAAAEDPRFSIAYSNDSGCGGAALSRRRFGETVSRITTAFPHWFSKNFDAYGEQEDKLPVDQHELFALIAPRAVYVASADLDLWADPKGEYAAVVAAAPVYQLLGEPSITESQMPALETPRYVGKTGYHVRRGAHALSPLDWQFFLDFAATQWR
ncbi:hypothetical protein SAMN06265222_102201 [Neorhodopirellula lusitana]|uniref:4-O-methyl-glucuronoyl methylesterase-like domain-containing protein n=1 Tax=Neorhodopirellula lusitana TaxID=445327 RepID=A0ABY1PXU2_9BACT|nr:acetylxylan esterase [Neorhodopirellula lusitana]SMP46921.1 hypothetical protein SAMN06265222_102201 [Neorhodopirellula lusitana]